MKRLIAAFAAALMLAVGVPGVASAANLPSDGHLTLVVCPGDNAIVFYGPSATGPQTGDTATLIDTMFVAGEGFEWEDPGTITTGFTGCDGPPGNLDSFPTEGVVTSELLDGIEEDSSYEEDGYSYSSLGIVVGETKYTFIHASEGLFTFSPAIFVVDYGTGGSGPSTPTTDPLTTSTPTLKRNGISFTPDNFDPTCAYEISTTAGTVKQNPVTGEVNVYGVGSGSSVSVTITDCTGATATVSGTATAATAPVQTLTKPTVAVAADGITCSAGTSTVNPTSIAYTLLVDGVAVSTRFSDGAIAPSLVATTAAQNLYTGATLSKATWSVDPAWAGKSYSCTTTSYAAGAVGIANS
jgi:hypothetical protein